MARRVLFVAPRPPHPVAGGQDLRVLQHLSVFRAAGWDVHLFALDPSSQIHGTENATLATCHVATDPTVVLVQGVADSQRLEWIGRGTNPFATAATATTLTELRAVIDTERPDLVVVTGHGASAVADAARSTGVPLVVDFHDVLAELITGTGSLQTGHPALDLLHRRAAQTAREIDTELLRLADEAWACSNIDAELLTDLHPTRVVTVANAVDVAAFPPPTPSPSPRMVFTAGFSYLPNQRAALELIDLLDHLPGVALDLVGTGGPEAFGPASQRSEVTVTGWVPDVRPYLQRAWVTVMPIRAGSGTRLKVGEAAAARVPIVATAKAVEGTSLQPDDHYLRAENLRQTVEAVRRLIDDADLRVRLSGAAHQVAVDELSWAAAGRVAVAAGARLAATGTVPR
ncbi:MAG: glycosyltransferase family 4 protein [Acidimicrobiales bacterium]